MFGNTTDTLVITSSINPVLAAPGVKITSPELRLFQLCCSFLSWAREDSINNVIICDNTLPKYDFEPLRDLANTSGKEIEILTFLGNRHEVEIKGKGYGEGEIIKHIFERSRIIKKCSSFYKITGRIFVGNFEAVHNTHLRASRLFDNPVPRYRRLAKRIAANRSNNSRHSRGMVRTVFYKCDTEFFKQELINKNLLVNDHERFYLEHAYFSPLIKAGFSTFKIKPELIGYSSSSGKLCQGADYPQEIKEEAGTLVAAMHNDVT